MKIFIFKKPKQTILNILYMVTGVSLFISILAVGIVILWKEYPQTVSKIDKMIPDFYGDNIKSLYKKAKNVKDEKEIFQYFSKLHNELKDISTLNKYYSYKSETIQYLIDYYTRIKKLDKAIRIATKWKNTHPYDFNAKFKYLDVLNINNKHEAKKYIDKLYNRYPDIQEVVSRKISFLVENGNINEAVLIESKNRKRKIDNTSFKVFFIDQPQTIFTANQSTTFSKDIFTKKNNKYSFIFKRKFKSLKGIRFDIDSLAVGSKIRKLDVKMLLDDKSYNISIKSLNQIKKLDNNSYEIDGEDPYFVFNLENELVDFNGKAKIVFSIVIEESSILNIISNKVEWQLFYSNSIIFTEKKSKYLSLKVVNNTLKDRFEFDKNKNIHYIRFDIPSIKELKVKNINILLNNSDLIDKKNIKSLHSISSTKDGYVVTGNDPYIVFKINNTNIKNVSIEVEF